MFQPRLLISDDTFILLNRIESIKTGRYDEDQLLDKLKGDVIITVTTVSGKTYEISLKNQKEMYEKAYNYTIPSDLNELCRIILETWVLLNIKE